jgi:hypothetical protein
MTWYDKAGVAGKALDASFTSSVKALLPSPKQPEAKPDASDEESEALIADLREAARQAGMQRDDPMMPLMTAFARAIRFLSARNAKSERIAAETTQRILDALLRSREASDAETKRFREQLAAVEAATIARIATSIARSADDALRHRVVVFSRAVSLTAAGVLFAVAGGCLGGGYWWGWTQATAGVHETEAGLRTAFAEGPAAAHEWLNLMQWNSVWNALVQCKDGAAFRQAGRKACNMPLWIEAPLPAVP